jgi:hypothetical protein
MKKLTDVTRLIPIIRDINRTVSFFKIKSKSKNTEQVFTEFYKSNFWEGKESVSGAGSSAQATKIIIKEFPSLFNDLNISTILDIPCGDFNWMKNIDMKKVRYIGADIVKEMIHKNTEKYKKKNISFQNLNLINEKLPKVDLILVRDGLVHFSFKDIFSSLKNICDSESKYLLTTTFTEREYNKDIETGNWSPLNLQAAPFLLPKPIRIINEGLCLTEGDGVNKHPYKDKSLGLWKIDDIRDLHMK